MIEDEKAKRNLEGRMSDMKENPKQQTLTKRKKSLKMEFLPRIVMKWEKVDSLCGN